MAGPGTSATTPGTSASRTRLARIYWVRGRRKGLARQTGRQTLAGHCHQRHRQGENRSPEPGPTLLLASDRPHACPPRTWPICERPVRARPLDRCAGDRTRATREPPSAIARERRRFSCGQIVPDNRRGPGRVECDGLDTSVASAPREPRDVVMARNSVDGRVPAR
jgi:hypothetical protein